MNHQRVTLDKPYPGIEGVPCSVCGTNDTRLLFQIPVRAQHRGLFNRDIWDIVQCKQCGLIYENPRPDADARKHFYDFANPTDYQYIQDWFLSNADLNRVAWRRILRSLRRLLPAGKLLDIGCGAGTFLVEARKAGFDVIGQEVAPFFVKYCREEQGLTIYDGELTNLGLEAASFDCVTAFDVLEHHPYPGRLVDEIRRIIRPGGIVIITTHDIGNVFARIYGPRWRHMGAIGHLTYFSRHTLSHLFEEKGFKVLRCGDAHVVDDHKLHEVSHQISQVVKLIILRTLIIGIYKPLASRFPALTHWEYRRKFGGQDIQLNHSKLLVRAGNQIIMGDEMILLAKATDKHSVAESSITSP